MWQLGQTLRSLIKNFENYCYTKAKETHNRYMVTPGKTCCAKPFSLQQGKANGIAAEKEIYALGGGEINSKCTICNFSSPGMAYC